MIASLPDSETEITRDEYNGKPASVTNVPTAIKREASPSGSNNEPAAKKIKTEEEVPVKSEPEEDPAEEGPTTRASPDPDEEQKGHLAGQLRLEYLCQEVNRYVRLPLCPLVVSSTGISRTASLSLRQGMPTWNGLAQHFG